MRSATVVFSGPASPGLTLAPLRRGGIDPCYRVDSDGAIWRTSLMPSGPVTARITRAAVDAADCQAWGEGADEFIDRLPALLGVDDDDSGFAPAEPTIAKARRLVPHLRLGRTGRMLEALIPAIIEQRVYGLDAWRAWRTLVTKFGTPAPGPSPAGMRVVPSAEVWRRIPSWEFHRANIDPGRARTIVLCAQRADSLERLTPERAAAGLRSLPGVGEWTVAETLQRTFGDADALSVGDYHLAKLVGQALLGEPVDDPGMVELLEPLRPHRHRAVRLLEASGMFVYRRRAARQAIPNLRAL
ncbi:DNA-3-methyladenine glycosylase family protein [Mycolicibacterium goodii]|uniref:DNA-3-methyladenine glycosylase family protein n=1 Tax=Mycolicibacterium goodii TaxID=134601 RepID=UPI001BDBDF9D|nr:DNA-3-methyladenine glycosylase 2 family protein [Mycolicibacterium goodii]MBU8807666.1 DNA-3-methyladenine glycosylase 2 family protein [Mycolicibacterium goodii]MBU8828214.1 DNA-3-methyladenine glycosylase 2 family protein [Mycolicibacterium goodii]